MTDNTAKILLVDDQPSKLLSYKVILDELGETLLTAGSARQAFEILLKTDVAVVLIDVCMPETDGFELAAMLREHPRFERTAIIFISAVVFDDVDRLRGYAMGAVDYVAIPVIPEVLRAKVKVFVDLHRKTKQLEQLNRDLEARVAERTAALAASAARLRQAEELRSLALAAGQMGAWAWDAADGKMSWDQGQHDIFGVDSANFSPTIEAVRALVHRDDLKSLRETLEGITPESKTFQAEFRVRRPNGDLRWCVGVAAASFDDAGELSRISGVTVDVTDRRRAEQRQNLLAEEVDHRARNVVAVIQAITRLTHAPTVAEYIKVLDGRISALSTAHKLLASSRWEGADLGRLVVEEMAPYQGPGGRIEIAGPDVLLPPATAQTIALALHELVTNAAKYGALSTDGGRVRISWSLDAEKLHLAWLETGGPKVKLPKRDGYGMRVIKGGVESQSGGKVSFDWQASGLSCTLSLRCAGEAAGATNGSAEHDTESAGRPSQQNSTQGVLLVEDEPMFSMMLADMLSESGHVVDGPYNKFGDAMVAAKNNNLCGGILDINLDGQSVYPVADILEARKIPFVFVTGYGAHCVAARFNHIPVLQKPVEIERVRDLLSDMRSWAEPS